MSKYKKECPDCVHFIENYFDCDVHNEGWLPGRTNYAMKCEEYRRDD